MSLSATVNAVLKTSLTNRTNG